MVRYFYKGIEWVALSDERIEKQPFKWGNKNIEPGHVFDKIGTKDRTSFQISDCKIQFCGRVGEHELLFSLIKGKERSEADGWFVSLSYVNSSTLLAQTSQNGFYDIRY